MPQVSGALNLYCEDMPEQELDSEEESEQESEDDFDESVSEDESEDDESEDEVRETEDSDETEDEIFDMEPDDAHTQLMQLSQQVVNSLFSSIPGLNAGSADPDDEDLDDEDLDELSTRLIAKHGLDILHLPLSRSYINWFKKDYFDKSNIGSWFITSLCCNRRVDANEIAPLPEEVQKLIFGFVSHSESYVNPRMQIQLRKVDMIPPALNSQVCTQDQVSFLTNCNRTCKKTSSVFSKNFR